jgi:hypothetical protein
MSQFSRRTILSATDTLASLPHTGIDRFALEIELENIVVGSSKDGRANSLARYLIENSQRADGEGKNLTDSVVIALIERAIARCRGLRDQFDYESFQRTYPTLYRGLERDGFTVEDGHLRRSLPEVLDLPQADDEVHSLLDRLHFNTPKGHLDQAIAAHVRGDWAAANAQFRPFIESLLDETAEHIAAGTTLPAPGNARRQWLATTIPPFFLKELNEWTGEGKGFLEGFYKRLHPQGAHPGLSDEEDSTFRLHIVLLVARLLLTRLNQRSSLSSL